MVGEYVEIFLYLGFTIIYIVYGENFGLYENKERS